jgi:type II secretory pathway pseudopilin PulG
LLEIAIALAIVGVLAAGAFKGYELLQRARLQKVVTEINAIKVAVTLFQERYGALPGDFSDARHALGLEGGNGDGRLHGDPLSPGSEPSLFWAHLKASGLITSLTFRTGRDVGPEKGVFVPENALKGGCFAVSDPSDEMEGTWLLLADAHDPARAVLTPAQAQTLDRSLDTGEPHTGQVRVKDASGGGCLKEGRYDTTHKRRCCLVYVALDA